MPKSPTHHPPSSHDPIDRALRKPKQETPTPPKRRTSHSSITLFDARPIKKPRRLLHGALSIPYNDVQQFWQDEQAKLFFVFLPSDPTNLKYAERHRLLDRMAYGLNGNRAVESVTEDREGGRIPWTVPKVLVEFGSVDYRAAGRDCDGGMEEGEGRPVAPDMLPGVDEMTVEEYRDAVERGDERVAGDQLETWEWCLGIGTEWLGCRER